MTLLSISRKLAKEVDQLRFEAPVTHCYNPLQYARRPHELYLKRFGAAPKQVLLVGMNPGPFGMAQTGIPFGDVAMVKQWMGIEARVDRPPDEHPKRPVQGFACARGEVSGSRLWGWAERRFRTPERFFEKFFVWNYCPLCFLEQSGRNRTPDKLPAAAREQLFAICNEALGKVIAKLDPQFVVGVGNFAAKRISQVLGERNGMTTGTMLHPSPASPAANQGWEKKAEKALRDLGVKL